VDAMERRGGQRSEGSPGEPPGKCLRSPRDRPAGRNGAAAGQLLSDDAGFDEDGPPSSRVRQRKTYCSGTAARPGMPGDGTPGSLPVRAGAFKEAMWYWIRDGRRGARSMI
jgi:hypothetical protein